MARAIETARLEDQMTASNPTARPPTTSPQPHTDFMEVRVHTAKCDTCDKHNKLTLYRCMDCGQHVCSLCWDKSGDGSHVFGGGSRNVPELQSNNVIENDKHGSGDKGHKNARRTRASRRVHVISDDEDDLPVLKPASITEKAGSTDASKQPSKSTNIIMDGDRHQDHEDDLPGLWPMVPARGTPVLSPGVPTADTSATESANPVMQGNPHIHEVENDPESQRTVQVYDELGRQTVFSPYAFVGDQGTKLQGRRALQPSPSNQQATRSAPFQDRPAIYRPRPGANVDLQAARNQLAFTNTQSMDRQAPRPPQSSTSNQQAARYAQFQDRPAIYRPRPGANVDLQAARNCLAFSPHQNSNCRQAPQPGQISVPHQQAAHLTPRPAPPSVSVSQHHVQTAANVDRAAVREWQALYVKQQAQVQAFAKAKQMEVRNRLALTSHQDAQLAANRDQVATHNREAYTSNRLASSAAGYEQILAARDQQQAYLSRQRAIRPVAGPAQPRVSYRGAPISPSVPAQAFHSQHHATFLNPRHAQPPIADPDRSYGPSARTHIREYSPERIEAADALLFYAGVEQNPRDRVPPAGPPETPSSASFESLSSSKTLVGWSGAAGAQSISPRGLPLTPSPGDTDGDSANARLDKHRRRLAGLQSPSDARKIVSDAPASQRGHPSHRHAELQPGSGATLAGFSAQKFNRSSSRLVQSPPGSRLPMSEHAATYLNQWNSGRAALSSKSSSIAVNVPAPQLESPRSAVPIVSVLDATAEAEEPGEVAEASIQAPNTPISMPGGPKDVDVTMGSPEVEIVEDDPSRSSEVRTPDTKPLAVGKDTDAEKHPRGENQDERKASKEHKASSDADVVDARKRNIMEEHYEQIDDDADDVETTSWNTLGSTKTTGDGDHPGANAGADQVDPGRIFRKGVARVKKPEPKARKGKTTPEYVG